ncbi:24608_t:CDS:2, partial [Gigaspora rosea]
MSQNKDKSATVEDKPLSSTNSDVKPTHKKWQANFESNFGHVAVDLLRFLYHELGIPEAVNHTLLPVATPMITAFLAWLET